MTQPTSTDIGSCLILTIFTTADIAIIAWLLW